MHRLVLYADDDADDRSWITEACQAAEVPLQLRFVQNGQEVLDYLLAAENLPSLIILDLNMPRLDGRQTLQRLKANASYCDIPVAIVSTSSSKIDKEVCQRLGAALFIVKPNSYDHWQRVVLQLASLAR